MPLFTVPPSGYRSHPRTRTSQASCRVCARLGDAHRHARSPTRPKRPMRPSVSVTSPQRTITEGVGPEFEHQRVADVEAPSSAAAASAPRRSAGRPPLPPGRSRLNSGQPPQVGSRPNSSPMNICSSTSWIGSMVAYVAARAQSCRRDPPCRCAAAPGSPHLPVVQWRRTRVGCNWRSGPFMLLRVAAGRAEPRSLTTGNRRW